MTDNMELTDAIKEAYANAPGDVTFYHTLTIMNDNFTSDIQVVMSNVELDTYDGTYSPAMFSLTLPEVKGGVVGEMKITINFLPKAARIAIREAAQQRDITTVIYRQYIDDNPEVDAELPFALEVGGVIETDTGIEAKARVVDLTRSYFPKNTMNMNTCPGLRL